MWPRTPSHTLTATAEEAVAGARRPEPTLRAPSVVAVREPGRDPSRSWTRPTRASTRGSPRGTARRALELHVKSSPNALRVNAMDSGRARSLRGGRSACDARGARELVRLQATHQAGLRGNQADADAGLGKEWDERKTRSETTVGARPTGGEQGDIHSLRFSNEGAGTRGYLRLTPWWRATVCEASVHVDHEDDSTSDGALATEGSNAREGSLVDSRMDSR